METTVCVGNDWRSVDQLGEPMVLASIHPLQRRLRHQELLDSKNWDLLNLLGLPPEATE